MNRTGLRSFVVLPTLFIFISCSATTVNAYDDEDDSINDRFSWNLGLPVGGLLVMCCVVVCCKTWCKTDPDRQGHSNEPVAHPAHGQGPDNVCDCAHLRRAATATPSRGGNSGEGWCAIPSGVGNSGEGWCTIPSGVVHSREGGFAIPSGVGNSGEGRFAIPSGVVNSGEGYPGQPHFIRPLPSTRLMEPPPPPISSEEPPSYYSLYPEGR